MYTNWEPFIIVDRGKIINQLNNHFHSTKSKLVIRGYTLKASGTTVLPNAIAEVLGEMLPNYVFGNKLPEGNLINITLRAIKYFGKKHPDTDGKFGELLLFALVESILGCKMVAHKIRTLTNPKDQVKGGDGVFIGDYLINDTEKNIAYLVGESKLMQTFNAALEDAYDSINRFHDAINSASFTNTELIIASENLFKDDSMTMEMLDELYDRLTPTSEIYKQQILVHPILIMYDSDSIIYSEIEAKNNNHLEELIKAKISNDEPYFTKKD